MLDILKRGVHAVASAISFKTDDPSFEELGKRLLALNSGLGLFRLAHLCDAIAQTPSPASIISVGSGTGLHEAFLARLFPSASVMGLDLGQPDVGVTAPNLTFRSGDFLDASFLRSVQPAEFVFSIECLEHIENDSAVAASMAALVRPGGLLYVEVPFATDDDLKNAALVQHELENFGHVRPGYSSSRLRHLCESNGLRVLSVAGAFWFPMQPLVWMASERFGSDSLAPFWSEFYELAMRDVRDKLPESRSQATAIRVLAQRPTD
jgi:SAM-dependent methyltransferase